VSGTGDVRLERRGPALWATIDRPRSANACGSGVMAALESWLEGVHDPGVRVLVLTGAGSVFCAGADLREAGALVDDRQALVAYLRRGRDLVAAIRESPVPVVAAVNGAAYAGGLELLLACDVAVASADARVGDRHVSQGQVPGWGSSAMLPGRVGRATATRLLLTGETMDAAEARAAGLVSEVVAPDRLQARVTELVDLLATHDPGAVRRLLTLTRLRGADEDAAARLEWHVLLEHVDAGTARRRAADF
jgi:enoyl-CoA hydratase